MKNLMKYTRVALMSIVFMTAGLMASSGFSEESINDIATNVKIKKAAIKGMKKMIASHKKMSFEEIISDLRLRHRKSQKELFKIALSDNPAEAEVANALTSAAARKTFDKQIAEYEKINDKETILLIENAHLQEMQSAGFYLFTLTRLNAAEMGSSMSAHEVPLLFLFILTVPVDIVLLPITFIVSAVTGF